MHDRKFNGRNSMRTLAFALALAVASQGLRAWAVPHDSETVIPDECPPTGLLAGFPGPSEDMPGLPRTAQRNAALEPYDGYGAIKLETPGSFGSYVSATFDRIDYPELASIDGWNFEAPSICYSPGGQYPADSTYSIRFSASVYRRFTYSSQDASGAYLYYGRLDNAESLLVVDDTGKAIVYDKAGRKFEFDDPMESSGSAGGPEPLRAIHEVGGSKVEFHYIDSKIREIRLYQKTTESPDDGKYVRVWRYGWWGTYGPTAVQERVAKADVTTSWPVLEGSSREEALWPYDDTNWALFRETKFTFYEGQQGYQDATDGDLIAVDVETQLTTGSPSLSRTVYKYHTNPELDAGDLHQVRAVVGPDSYRDFVITEQADDEEIFTATLEELRGQPPYQKNYLDVEMEYFPEYPQAPYTQKEACKLHKLTVRNLAGSCGCAGSTGGVFWYRYAFNAGTPTLAQWASQVSVTKGASEASAIPYAYFEYNTYAKKVLQAIVDPGDSSRMQVRHWRYDTTTGHLTAEFYPSACASYDPQTHAIGLNGYSGLVYWFYYTSSGNLPYVRYVKFSEGELNSRTTLTYASYTTVTDGYRRTQWLSCDGRYTPLSFFTYYSVFASYTSDPLAKKEVRRSLPAVSTGYNGEYLAYGYRYEYLDLLGRPAWTKDEMGAVTHTVYHPYVDAVTSETVNVNTTQDPPPTTSVIDLHDSFGGTPLHLTTEYELDTVGRVIKVVDAEGRNHRRLYTTLSGGQEVTVDFPHLNEQQATVPVGAASISVSYQGGPAREVAAVTLNALLGQNYASLWDPSEAEIEAALAGYGVVLSRTRYVYENGHLAEVQRFIDATNSEPESNTYVTTYGYDDRGNLYRVEDPPDGAAPGTITRRTYDFLGRLERIEIGSDDGVSGNMTLVERRYYDGSTDDDPGLGDGKLTRRVQKVDSNPAHDRVTSYEHDYSQEGRLRKITGPTGTVRTFVYNRAGSLTEEKLYAGSEASENLRAYNRRLYDNRDRLYEVRAYAANPQDGTYVSTRYWRDQLGRVVKQQDNGGILAKSFFDGAGRLVRQTLSHDTSETDYSGAVDPTLQNDTVVTQTESIYDKVGNVIVQKSLARQPGYSNTGLLHHGTPTEARGSYVAMWYDSENRMTHRGDYGDNGNQDMTSQPDPRPEQTNPGPQGQKVLLAKSTYNPLGQLKTSTDTAGLETERVYDDLGNLMSVTENEAGTGVWSNRVTEYTYTPTGQVRTITAATAGEDPGDPEPQITTYIYGVNPSQEGGLTTITSNRLLYSVENPRDDQDPDNVTYGYNAQGEVTRRKDASGIIHQYGRNGDGSLESDVVVAPYPSGFDDTVKSLWRTYDGVGRLSSVTSRQGTTDTSTADNGVLFAYDKYGQIAAVYQSPTGEATTGSPVVSYAYNYPSAGGLPGLRLASTTYPSSLVIAEDYSGSATDSNLSRPSGRSLSSGVPLFLNEYLGASRVLTRHQIYDTYPSSPRVDWKVTLDTFARVETLKVTHVSSGVNWNYYEYGYELNSDVSYRKEFTTSGQSESYDYNDLDMLSLHKRGAHDASGDIPGPTSVVSWAQPSPPALDHSGNWRSYLVLPGSTTPYYRDFNGSNELQEIHYSAESSDSLSYDDNGNTTSAGLRNYVYDFWNRLSHVMWMNWDMLAFRYNGLNWKIEKSELYTGGKLYFYGADWRVLQEYDSASGQPLYSYVWGTQYIDELVARRTESTGAWEYWMQDANFNTVSRVDASGNATHRYTYTAYGEPTQLTVGWGTPTAVTEDLYLFTGREYHQLFGLYDYRNRAYDPWLGRFLQRDPSGAWSDSSGFGNFYSFLGSSPISGVDPLGLWEIDVHYYLTKYLCMKTGCFSEGSCEVIAQCDQGTDEWFPAGANFLHHSVHFPGPKERTRLKHRAFTTCRLCEFGVVLHAIQDQWSHEPYRGKYYGHAKHGHLPDKTNLNYDQAVKMVKGSLKAICDFAEECCYCEKCSEEHVFRKHEYDIRLFLEIPGGTNPAASIENYPDALLNKRNALELDERDIERRPLPLDSFTEWLYRNFTMAELLWM